MPQRLALAAKICSLFMKQPESSWHSVQAEMQARLATLHSQAVSKQKAGKMEIQEHYAEFIKSCEVRMTKVKLTCQCCSEENDEAVLKLAEVQQA